MDDISDEIWASLKKTVGKEVEWVKVDTEDSDDEGDSEEDDDVMSIDGFELDAEDEDEDEDENENEEDFFEAEDQHMAHEELLNLQDVLWEGLQGATWPGDEDAWEDVDDVD